jgi:hypothetical protein
MRAIWQAILWLDRLSLVTIYHWLLRRHWMIRAATITVPTAALCSYRDLWGLAGFLALLSLFFLQHGIRNDPDRLRRLDELDALDALAEMEESLEPVCDWLELQDVPTEHHRRAGDC